MEKVLPGQPQAKTARAPPSLRVLCLPAVPAPPVACGPEATLFLIQPHHAGARGWRGIPSRAELGPPMLRRYQASTPGEPHLFCWSSWTLPWGRGTEGSLGRAGWDTGLHVLCLGAGQSHGSRQSFGDGAKALFSVWAVTALAMTLIWALQCQAQLSPSLPLQLRVPAALSFSFLW